MSEHGNKRKRGPQDSSIELSNKKIALNHLEALKKELDGIDVKEELHDISEHVLALENILKGSKKTAAFSTVTTEDLKKAGVMRKRLAFDSAEMTWTRKRLSKKAEDEITDLHRRIKKIYASISMEHRKGSHMILNAILLSLAGIFTTKESGVAILPAMINPQGEGVRISLPSSEHELRLSGNLSNYAIIEYEDVDDYKDRLLGGSKEDTFDISRGRMLVVEAKQNPEQSLAANIPEAVGQAIAMMKSANLEEVRFCLSDGHSWIFFILKSENGTMTYYESAIRRLSKDILARSKKPLREIILILCEWLDPTIPDLFTIE